MVLEERVYGIHCVPHRLFEGGEIIRALDRLRRSLSENQPITMRDVRTIFDPAGDEPEVQRDRDVLVRRSIATQRSPCPQGKQLVVILPDLRPEVFVVVLQVANEFRHAIRPSFAYCGPELSHRHPNLDPLLRPTFYSDDGIA